MSVSRSFCPWVKPDDGLIWILFIRKGKSKCPKVGLYVLLPSQMMNLFGYSSSEKVAPSVSVSKSITQNGWWNYINTFHRKRSLSNVYHLIHCFSPLPPLSNLFFLFLFLFFFHTFFKIGTQVLFSLSLSSFLPFFCIYLYYLWISLYIYHLLQAM